MVYKFIRAISSFSNGSKCCFCCQKFSACVNAYPVIYVFRLENLHAFFARCAEIRVGVFVQILNEMFVRSCYLSIYLKLRRKRCGSVLRLNKMCRRIEILGDGKE